MTDGATSRTSGKLTSGPSGADIHTLRLPLQQVGPYYDTFKPVVVTPRDSLCSALLQTPERPFLPPPVVLYVRAFAAARDRQAPVTLLRAHGSIVIDNLEPLPVEAQIRHVGFDKYEPGMSMELLDPPEISSGPPTEVECTFHIRLPEALHSGSNFTAPDRAMATDVVFYDHLQRPHPVREIDLGPVLDQRGVGRHVRWTRRRHVP